jgi:hypothetical protein
MMRKKTNLLMYVFVCAWLSTLLSLAMPLKTMTYEKIEDNDIQTDSITVETPSVNPRDSIKNELLLEVENYIYSNFPKTNEEIPTAIVENGLEQDIDIMFMMAQTQRETSFGTAGIGRETSKRSLFGVVSRRYGTYNAAVVDYISILKKWYLTRGRTEQHLMQRYITSGGGRYAKDPYYESKIRETYAYIKRKTNIRKLQLEYKKYEEN